MSGSSCNGWTARFSERPDYPYGVIHHLESAHAILVPGGFGNRGTGMIRAAQFARERSVPYLGICFGMQMAVIEAARNMAGLRGAGSTEFGECGAPDRRPDAEWMRATSLEQRVTNGDLGGTMRLGAYPCHTVRIRGRATSMARRKSRSGIATAMRSISTIVRRGAAGLRFRPVAEVSCEMSRFRSPCSSAFSSIPN